MKIRLILFCLLVLSATFCVQAAKFNNNTQTSTKITMNKPPKDYAKEWTKVDSLVSKGLPQSALEVVTQIYKDAKATDNAPQFLKAIIYKMRLASDYQEDYLVGTIDSIKMEIQGSKGNVAAILHSMLAEIYWSYYQSNRYNFLNRSQTIDFKQDDIHTWDARKIIREVISHYQASLINPTDLQKVKLDIFNPILKTYDKSIQYRPTLYDFLAHRAIDFFMNSESGLTESVDKFEIKDGNFLADLSTFTQMNLATVDTFAMKFYATKLFQDILKFHQNDADPKALIDAELKRLTFMYQNCSAVDKDQLYMTTLTAFEKKYQNIEAGADITYRLANLYYSWGSKYQPLANDDHKWDYKTALSLCEQAIAKYPDSDGGKNCLYLREQIIRGSISMTAEEANIPDQPMRVLVSYKNAPQIYYRLLKLDPEKNRKMLEKTSGEELANEYIKMKPVQEWSVNMPDDGDYQPHSAEIKVPAQAEGLYLLLASDNSDFSYSDQIVCWSTFWVTNMSFISRTAEKGAMDFYVLDRDNGQPMKDVKVETYTRDYNYNTRKYEYKKWQNYTTDADGYFAIPAMKTDANDYKYFYADFFKGDDRYSSNSYFYQYPNYENEEPALQSFFFLDRAIYRPGQTIYFKGILLKKTDGNFSIQPNHSTTVTLYDVNYQKVEDLYLVSNEFGTFSGSFTAPSNGLTGQMHIDDNKGSVYFSVEEYKRPKFEVDFEPIKGTYKLDDLVKVTGFAKAYAGNAIDGANVKYRVVRNGRFPYWGRWWGYYCPTSAQMEIMNGEMKTDDDGKFNIEFKAIPDLTVNSKYRPIFDYTVYADVTDINGETHSSSTYVSVGYTALLVNVSMSANMDRKEENKFYISSTNFSGTTEHTDVKIKIWELQQPAKTFRDRRWSQADKYTMTREEYEKNFPNDIYADENSMYKWEKGKLYFDKDYNTAKDSVFDPQMSKWPSGKYMLIISAVDKYGTEVEARQYFTIYTPDDKQIPEMLSTWYADVKSYCEPGEKAEFLYGTREKELNVLYEIEHMGKIIKKQWIKLGDEMKSFEIPVTEEMRGNFGYHLTTVKNNRYYSFDQTVTVPYTNKALELKFETFRDKLLPGQEEEWKMTISGMKGDKVLAEMVATMYDASLDAFRANYWSLNLLNYNWASLYWNADQAFTTRWSDSYMKYVKERAVMTQRHYDYLNWFGFVFYNSYYKEGFGAMTRNAVYSTGANVDDFDYETDAKVMPANPPAMDGLMAGEQTAAGNSEPVSQDQQKRDLNGKDKVGTESQDVQLRSNFNETAFFYPHLMTNDKGEVVIKFTVPETLTRWKFMALAHTKDLKTGQLVKEIVTQKELMVVPNPPRFFRENDRMFFSAKISNVSDKDLSGEATLQFFDATNMKPINDLMKLSDMTQSFSIEKGKSTALAWEISIPEGVGAISYRIVAKAGQYSDGEEMAIPVLTNRMLVTESMPLPIKGNQTKEFTFTKLLNSESSTTIRQHKFTLEYSSNPAWYAIQALPYLMEYPYECSEQTFNRYYANSIASHVANSSPRIKQVFDSWKNFTPDALLSNLEKNQELKSLILEETPWVLDAKNETERKQRVALLFDLNRMANEQARDLLKLEKKQTSNGGWSWFDGMQDDRYITQYIITGFGHLDHLGVKDIREQSKVWSMISRGVIYLDDRMQEDYENVKKWYPKEMDKCHIGYTQIQYLYARSYFKDLQVDKRNQDGFNYFKGQAGTYWNTFNRYSQGMIALALHRYEDAKTPADIIKSLKETSLHNEEMGMYWRDMSGGYYWYQAPIETQALLIECFDEVANDKDAVEEMKVWLLKQKQTQDWKTTKATAEACYALLLKGTDLLASTKLVEINIGGVDIDPMNLEEVKVEAGTGYFKSSWSGSDVKPEMGNIKVTKTDDGVAWGAVYWQYFEQLDKITPAETPLKLEKKLFRTLNTPTGPVIEPVTEDTKLKVGDKLKVRIELRVDRDMEYVHMKDMRASGFEPTNVISRYKYQDGLGYYESTRDAATNFFFHWLPKGTYVFEYTMFVTHKGDFSNGVTTIQCMYAPEFTSHSEGIRVKVEE